MFGREPRLPIDMIFSTQNEVGPKLQKSYQKYVEDWEYAMNQAFEIAKKHNSKSIQTSKQQYDKKVRGVDIEVGDRILLRNHREKGGTGKLRNYWENTIYIVREKYTDIPVYRSDAASP